MCNMSVYNINVGNAGILLGKFVLYREKQIF